MAADKPPWKRRKRSIASKKVCELCHRRVPERTYRVRCVLCGRMVCAECRDPGGFGDCCFVPNGFEGEKREERHAINHFWKRPNGTILEMKEDFWRTQDTPGRADAIYHNGEPQREDD